MKKIFDSLIFKLVLAVTIGLIVGFISSESVMNVIVTLKYVLGQVIFFSVPLIIIGFIAPSIAKLRHNASQLLGFAIGFAYISSVGAAAFSAIFGYILIPKLSIASTTGSLRELPELIFQLDIPQVMPVMSALFLSIIVGLAVTWTKADLVEKFLNEFQNIVLSLVNKVVIPILPFFIATTFASLAYEGSITNHLPVFLKVIVIVLIGHFIWMSVLYLIAGIMSGKNPMEVIKYYGPAYLTAVGSMSSAATLPVALECANKSKVLRKDILDFSVPLCSNIHLCGSVLTEVFFVMVVSQILYGHLPSVGNMVLFILLLGVFAIGAPGVPGGTVMASLGLITSVLGFNETGTALILTIFALQDSFGTACNVVGDGALTLMLTGVADKKNIKSDDKSFNL
ncbi:MULTISPECIES: dicarboxylate/amino acid:cation symporter [Romboutsia]|uniref:dicarboxylate/amino acid:cation symporter n=1 Tax=Romboutsia TaxID=1501226 RepID=UPI000B284BC2|nr:MULTISPECIES: dicarboxylate/amino acid:cation symporter [Romboutsia]MCH1959835.1 dicarboxylate/amino acid:cation symporter [Romboutsia hominis]MCH1969742.1 dicarboxylate/amino acid:cation symporter [Romboutsia hominis]MDB8791564.1 dicarboxylate/amino acid:cation symporter [Romboutsia sp. 1001216sp1]MDB8801047.1 dicarboxylate/amino acid:cation symporter [Romboutsia sp. 1001216sp1]MDB8812446.1 dicarboxylate/amino acid:cation symporter [Romboutsia sp. 1001216sp1]